MKYRTVVRRAGEVGRQPAARGEHQVERFDAAAAVEARTVAIQEVVTLAGAAHVIVAVDSQLDRPSGRSREEGGRHGVDRRLRLLAAEAAAEATQLDRHRRIGQAKRRGDEALDLS